MAIDRKDFFAFVHIEKTAGSSLHQLLLESFPRYLSVHPAYLSSIQRHKYLFLPRQLKYLNLFYRPVGIGGHKVRSYLDYESVVGEGIRYFTFLRDPVKRYLSQFQYLSLSRGLRCDFDGFLKLEDPRNLQLKRISGGCDLDFGRMQLRKYNFVGFVENFSRELRLLSYHVFNNKLRVRSIVRNPTKERILPKFEDMPVHWKNAIVENNRLDIELYQWAKAELAPNFEVPEKLLRPIESGSAPSLGRVHNLEFLKKGIRRYGLEPMTYGLSKVL